MSPAALERLQADFAAALLSADPSALPASLDGTAETRFRVYRNNFYHGLGEQLALAYPVVRRLVGEAFFQAATGLFVQGAPPRTRSLALYGAGFADFLEGFAPGATLPYLPDIARLERARLEALHAADMPPLPPRALADVPTRLAPHPAARLVVSRHPIIDIWRANQPSTPARPCKLEANPQCVLVTRPALTLEMRALTPRQAEVTAGLLTNGDLAGALATSSGGPQQIDFATLLGTLVAAGAFSTTSDGRT